MTSRSDYLNVQGSGSKFHGRYILLLSQDNGLPESRFGITVSRKVGNAVKRNRVKRKIREIQRLNRNKTAIGSDIVVIARHTAVNTRFGELEAEYMKLIGLAGLAIKEPSS